MQIYGPGKLGYNYTSPQIHHVLLTGLEPETTYYYQCALEPDPNPASYPARASAPCSNQSTCRG